MSGPAWTMAHRGACAALAALCTLAACHRAAAPMAPTPPPAPVRPGAGLAGLRIHLALDPGLGLAVEGRVGETPAEVVLEPASPLTTVTDACFPGGPPSSPGTVRVPRPQGGHAALPEIWLPRARLGSVEVGGRKVALVRGRACVLALGSDVLGPYALQVDPSRRELLVSPSRPRADYLAELTTSGRSAVETHVVELSRDPDGDWPLLSARLRQGKATLTGTFVLSTGDARSTLGEVAAERAGLVSERAELRALGVSNASAGSPGYALDGLELLPGLALSCSRLVGDPGWRNPGALGVLGADVWGRFQATLDVRAELLVLRRPGVLASGALQRCAEGTGEGFSEEACYVLHATPRPDGLEVVATVWRELPEGGRLHLQLLDDRGQPLETSCRAGLAFGPADRGTSAVWRLPWAGLDASLPACARELARARGAARALFEEGPLPACPGDCAFVTHLPTRQVRCDCPLPGPSAISNEERLLLQRLRRLPGGQQGAPAPPAPDDEPGPEPGS